MEDLKKQALEYVESRSGDITDVSHAIWGFAELSLKEYKSAAYYVQKLKEEGFEVEEGLCGIDTAFSGKFGSGKPVIAILAEFDALSGLSQRAGATERDFLEPDGSGHGCGHNMLGAGSFGAALGIKHYLEQSGKSGTVIFYGCPGEEGGASKALMARDKVWKECDVALTWHPADCFQVTTGTCNSCIQTLYKFKGVAAHAAGNPHEGRSALDAAELMNVGVQFLREHAKPDARIHYAIINGGGWSPNVVQPYADLLYMVRSTSVGDAVALQKRVDKIAKAAADMTETSVEKIFVDACSNTVMNTVLEKLVYSNMEQIPIPEYTDEEWAFAEKLRETFPGKGKISGAGAQHDEEIAAKVKELSEDGKRAINDFLMPFFSKYVESPGSTDVGDVSWEIPTVQMGAATYPAGSPGHSWQNVSCGATSIGDKGLMYAAKVLCASAIDLLNSPKTISAAKKEQKKRVKDAGGYQCPVPKGAKLYVIE
ncbi:MAG: amidohydrolase [Firmicutes bacterium]|nr:amidohydrolase [Bacillota bacterium]